MSLQTWFETVFIVKISNMTIEPGVRVSTWIVPNAWYGKWGTTLNHPSLFDLPTKWSKELYKIPALSAGIYWTAWPDQIQKLTLKLLNHYSLLRFLRIGVCPSRGRCLHSTMWHEV